MQNWGHQEWGLEGKEKVLFERKSVLAICGQPKLHESQLSDKELVFPISD